MNAENGNTDGAGPPVVALGKFDALHLGHYALAEQV